MPNPAKSCVLTKLFAQSAEAYHSYEWGWLRLYKLQLFWSIESLQHNIPQLHWRPCDRPYQATETQLTYDRCQQAHRCRRYQHKGTRVNIYRVIRVAKWQPGCRAARHSAGQTQRQSGIVYAFYMFACLVTGFLQKVLKIYAAHLVGYTVLRSLGIQAHSSSRPYIQCRNLTYWTIIWL